MGLITRGYTFGTTEQVTNSKLHELVDNSSVTSITNADIDVAAAISESKLSFDGTTVCKLTDEQTIVGAKTFSALTRANAFVGSTASIATITNKTFTSELVKASLASLGSAVIGNVLAIGSVFRSNQSICSISNLKVQTINGEAYGGSRSYGSFVVNLPDNTFDNASIYTNLAGSAHTLFGVKTTFFGGSTLISMCNSIMASSGYLNNFRFSVGAITSTNLTKASFAIVKNFSVVLLCSTANAGLFSSGSLISFASGDRLGWRFISDPNGDYEQILSSSYEMTLL